MHKVQHGHSTSKDEHILPSYEHGSFLLWHGSLVASTAIFITNGLYSSTALFACVNIDIQWVFTFPSMCVTIGSPAIGYIIVCNFNPSWKHLSFMSISNRWQLIFYLRSIFVFVWFTFFYQIEPTLHCIAIVLIITHPITVLKQISTQYL